MLHGHHTGRDDLVLTSPGGAVLRSGTFRRRFFDPAARVAGLEDLSPHDLRHTAASLLVASGANVKAVQRMLGHASAAMTLDVNSGLFDDDLGARGMHGRRPRGVRHETSRRLVWARGLIVKTDDQGPSR